MPSILFYQGLAWCPTDKDSDEFQSLPCELVATNPVRVKRIIMLVDSPIEAKAPVGLNDASAWPIYAVSPRKNGVMSFARTDILRSGVWIYGVLHSFEKGESFQFV